MRRPDLYEISMLKMSSGSKYSRPLKASWSAVPALLAISIRARLRDAFSKR